MKKAFLILFLAIGSTANGQLLISNAANNQGLPLSTGPGVDIQFTGLAGGNSLIATITTTAAIPLGVHDSDITPKVNCTTSGFSGSGSVYTVTVTPTALGTFSIAIPANKFVDHAGLFNLASNTAQSVNAGAPALQIAEAAYFFQEADGAAFHDETINARDIPNTANSPAHVPEGIVFNGGNKWFNLPTGVSYKTLIFAQKIKSTTGVSQGMLFKGQQTSTVVWQANYTSSGQSYLNMSDVRENGAMERLDGTRSLRDNWITALYSTSLTVNPASIFRIGANNSGSTPTLNLTDSSKLAALFCFSRTLTALEIELVHNYIADHIASRGIAIDTILLPETVEAVAPNSTTGGQPYFGDTDLPVPSDVLAAGVSKHQNTHPSILDMQEQIASTWGGYRYWLCYTPVPNGSGHYENPCINASNDEVSWVDNPLGSPLDPAPASGEHSDVDLKFVAGESKMLLLYREWDGAVPGTIKYLLSTSTDGWAHKTGPTSLFTTTSTSAIGFGNNLYSPTLIYNPDSSRWYMYGSQLDNTAHISIFARYDATSYSGTWGNYKQCSMPKWGGGPWHQWGYWDSELHCAVIIATCPTTGAGSGGTNLNLYAFSSKDMTHWYRARNIILPNAGAIEHWDGKAIYRATLFKRGGKYIIYYGAKGSIASDGGLQWRMGKVSTN